MAESKWPITWDARWIWAGPAPLPVSPIGAAGIPPNETWNRFCYLPRTVQMGVIPAGSWKGRAARARRDVVRGAALPVPPIEILDGAAIPAGWNDATFDDSDWQPAVELSAGTFSYNRTRIPVEPFTSPEPDEIAPLTSIPVALKELTRRAVAALNSHDPRSAYPTADKSID